MARCCFTTLKWIPRLLALAMSVNLYLDVTGPTMVPHSERFAANYLAYTGVLCLVCNIGMWLVSSYSLRNRKALLTVLHVPSVFLAMSLAAEFGLVVWLAMILTLTCYWLLFRHGEQIREVA